jgi:integrase
VKPATINRALAFLRFVMRQEARADRVPDELAVRVARVELLDEPDGRNRYLRAGEEAKLRASLPSYLVPVMETLLKSAARLGEIAKLRKEDVDLDERRITIRGTKSGRDRVLPIGQKLAELLRDAMDRSSAEVVFPTPAGRPYKIDSLSRAFARGVKTAGLKDFHAHDLRHTAATRLAAVSPLHVVQRFLGHADVSTTVRRYAHVQDDQLRDAAAFLDAAAS